MLLWLQQKSIKPIVLLQIVIGLSCGIHLFICIVLLFFYHDGMYNLRLNIHSSLPKNVIIQVMPLIKSTGSLKHISKNKLPQQKITKNMTQTLPLHTVHQSTQYKTRIHKENIQLPLKQKNNKKRSLQKTIKNKIISKQKITDDNNAKATKLLENTNYSSKQSKINNNQATTQKLLDQTNINETFQKNDNQNNISDKTSNQEVTHDFVQLPSPSEVQGDTKESMDIFIGRDEFESLKIQNELQESIIQVWTPPAGMPLSLKCDIELTIGWDGSLKEERIIESSNVMLYDIAVQDAVRNIEFPRLLWGKCITITFSP